MVKTLILDYLSKKFKTWIHTIIRALIFRYTCNYICNYNEYTYDYMNGCFYLILNKCQRH